MPTLIENFYKNSGLGIFTEGEGYDAGLAAEMAPKTYHNMFSPSKIKLLTKVSNFAKETMSKGGRVSIMFSDGREYPIDNVIDPSKVDGLIDEMNTAIMNKDKEALKDFMRIFFRGIDDEKMITLRMPDFVKFVEIYVK